MISNEHQRCFKRPSIGAKQSGVLHPQDRKRSEQQKSAHVTEPPRHPDASEFAYGRESAKRETREPKGCADRRRQHAQPNELEKILSMLEHLATIRVTQRQLHGGDGFQGVACRHAQRCEYRPQRS
jgi:hypothetical protein